MSDFFAILALNYPLHISLSIFFLNKVILSHRSKVLLSFFFVCDFVADLLRRVVLSSTYCGVWFFRQLVMGVVVSSYDCGRYN